MPASCNVCSLARAHCPITNISSTAAETRVTDGRLAQANGGGAQFSLVVPRTGGDNASIDATLDRMNLGNLIVALPFSSQTREQIGDTQGEVSGTVHITGMPSAMMRWERKTSDFH